MDFQKQDPSSVDSLLSYNSLWCCFHGDCHGHLVSSNIVHGVLFKKHQLVY
jgi:hypothetical protein